MNDSPKPSSMRLLSNSHSSIWRHYRRLTKFALTVRPTETYATCAPFSFFRTHIFVPLTSLLCSQYANVAMAKHKLTLKCCCKVRYVRPFNTLRIAAFRGSHQMTGAFFDMYTKEVQQMHQLSTSIYT